MSLAYLSLCFISHPFSSLSPTVSRSPHPCLSSPYCVFIAPLPPTLPSPPPTGTIQTAETEREGSRQEIDVRHIVIDVVVVRVYVWMAEIYFPLFSSLSLENLYYKQTTNTASRVSRDAARLLSRAPPNRHKYRSLSSFNLHNSIHNSLIISLYRWSGA